MISEDINIIKLIDLAIEEDVKNNDITTNSILVNDETKEAVFICKQDGVIAGLDVAKMVMQKFDPEIIWNNIINDGDACVKSERIAYVKGSYKALLSGE
ncbi:MAG: nicotinate-nucleotide diphosphorylase (carboxylating), partial [Ignavibacteriales bacterium]